MMKLVYIIFFPNIVVYCIDIDICQAPYQKYNCTSIQLDYVMYTVHIFYHYRLSLHKTKIFV